MHKNKLVSLIALSVVQLFAGISASAVVPASVDQLTKQALSEYKLGHVPVAVRVEKDAVKQFPSSWLAHSTLSVLSWHAGDITTALAESKQAAKLAPTNPTALYNAALFHHLLAMYPEACVDYQNTIKVAPDDWQARLGYVQCLINQTREAEAKRVLDEMLKSDTTSFDWWNEVAQTQMAVKEYKKAQHCFEKALIHAPEEEKVTVESSLFLASVKAEDYDRAESVQKQIVDSGSKNDFVYIESARLLAKTPAQGEWLLNGATRNIKDKGDVFFELSRQYLRKAKDSTHAGAAKDSPDSDAWQALAAKAIDHAIELSPGNVDFRWQKVAVLDRAGKSADLISQVTDIHRDFKDDRLAQYFLVLNGKHNNDVASALKAAIRPDSTNAGTAGNGYKLTIALGNFRVVKVSCACHLPQLPGLVGSAPGAFFAEVDKSTGKQPVGTVCFDASRTTLPDILKAGGKLKDEFAPISTQPVESMANVIAQMFVGEDSKNRLQMINFQGGEPRMPNVLALNSDQ